jgi:phage terminase large subunit GpA-like protein
MTMPAASVDLSPIGGFFRGLKPDPILKPSEWATEYRILPQDSAEPGKFRISRTPYIIEILDKLGVSDPAQKIIVMKGAQLAFTESGNNWLGYTIDIAPAPFLYVMPTDAMMKSTSKKRIKPMIESTPKLASKIKPSRAKDSGNTILEKEYEGGSLKMIGANSPVGLASAAIRYVYFDEIDRYPLDVGGEGSALSLGETRTATYGSRKKIFCTSTPTRKGQSAIDHEFEKTGQREYFVPCPLCAAIQTLKFTQLRYEKGKYSEIKYECEHCHGQFSERYKTQMLAAGQWVAKYPEKEDGITFGYHINSMYSPLGWYSWADMAREYEESEGDIPKRITWTNTKNGQCYEHEGDTPQWELIYAQRENYQKGTVKESVAFITAGVDIQADRIEVEVVGWMKGKKSQSIDYRVITGDTSQDGTWDKLALMFEEKFIRSDGAQLQINLMAIDTGYNTSHVYDFCNRPVSIGRAIPIKGKDDMSMMFTAPRPVQYTRQGQKVGSVKVYHVGVSMIKSELYGYLKLVKGEDGTTPNGFCHFPEYGTDYFRGITAEKLERKTNSKNFNVFQWVKYYKRNEPLDCRVYARAAAAIYNMDLFPDTYWDALVLSAGGAPSASNEKKERRKSSGYW